MSQFRNPKIYAEDCYRSGATLRDIAAESRSYPHVPASFWLDAMQELLRLEAESDVSSHFEEHRRLAA